MAESPTNLLRQVSPRWAWVRENVDIRLAGVLLGVLAAAISAWFSLKGDVRQLKSDVAQLTGLVSRQPDNTAEVAALKQQVMDLKEQVEMHQRWKEKVEGVAEQPVRRRR